MELQVLMDQVDLQELMEQVELKVIKVIIIVEQLYLGII